MHQNQSAGIEFEGAFGHFAGIYGDVVYGALSLGFVGDERVFVPKNNTLNCSVSRWDMVVWQ